MPSFRYLAADTCADDYANGGAYQCANAFDFADAEGVAQQSAYTAGCSVDSTHEEHRYRDAAAGCLLFQAISAASLRAPRQSTKRFHFVMQQDPTLRRQLSTQSAWQVIVTSRVANCSKISHSIPCARSQPGLSRRSAGGGRSDRLL